MDKKQKKEILEKYVAGIKEPADVKDSQKLASDADILELLKNPFDASSITSAPKGHILTKDQAAELTAKLAEAFQS